MTASALTRPGQRSRLSEKLTEIDWRLAILLCLIAGLGAMILYSAAGNRWSPWADKQLIRFAMCLVLMLALSLVDLRVWFQLAYPTYAVGMLLLLAVMVVGRHHLAPRAGCSTARFRSSRQRS